MKARTPPCPPLGTPSLAVRDAKTVANRNGFRRRQQRGGGSKVWTGQTREPAPLSFAGFFFAKGYFGPLQCQSLS